MAKTILVVDDSPVIRALHRMTLAKAGYEVREAGDGVEAQTQVDGVDAGLCDLAMPRLDGLGFLRWLRGNPPTRRVPLVFLTTQSRENLMQAGRTLGASAWITKPCAPERLTQVMQRVCPSA